MPAPSLVHLKRPPLATSAAKAPLLLLLHGVGSDERDLMGLAPHLDPRAFIVSARAPNALGPGANAWFTFSVRPDGTRLVDTAQAEASRLRILQFLGEFLAAEPGIDPARVYLVGFSQGAIMAASVLLTEPARVGGIVMMSGRVLPEALAARAPDAALAGKPVLVVHGTADGVLPIAHGRETRAAFSKLPLALTYQEFAMGHEVSAQSLAAVTAWLSRELDR